MTKFSAAYIPSIIQTIFTAHCHICLKWALEVLRMRYCSTFGWQHLVHRNTHIITTLQRSIYNFAVSTLHADSLGMLDTQPYTITLIIRTSPYISIEPIHAYLRVIYPTDVWYILTQQHALYRHWHRHWRNMVRILYLILSRHDIIISNINISTLNMCTILLRFVMLRICHLFWLIHVMYLPQRDAALVLGEPYNFPGNNYVTLKDMNQTWGYKIQTRINHYIMIKHEHT